MKRFILLLLVLCSFIFVSCTSQTDFEKGKRMLEQQGYTSVENIGYRFFCCGKGDNFSTGFSAIDKDGNEITGAFCSGILKGITIRFD